MQTYLVTFSYRKCECSVGIVVDAGHPQGAIAPAFRGFLEAAAEEHAAGRYGHLVEKDGTVIRPDFINIEVDPSPETIAALDVDSDGDAAEFVNATIKAAGFRVEHEPGPDLITDDHPMAEHLIAQRANAAWN